VNYTYFPISRIGAVLILGQKLYQWLKQAAIRDGSGSILLPEGSKLDCWVWLNEDGTHGEPVFCINSYHYAHKDAAPYLKYALP
jgi:hypothetical protein